MAAGAVVFLIGGPTGDRRSLAQSLRVACFEVHEFERGREFLAAVRGDADCLVIELGSPGDAVQVLDALGRTRVSTPVVLSSVRDGVATTVRVLTPPPVAQAERPFDIALMERVGAAVEVSVLRHRLRRRRLEWRDRLRSISGRPRDVLAGMMRGLASKDIARGLGLSVRTVERHRNAIMNQLGLDSGAGLLRAVLFADDADD